MHRTSSQARQLTLVRVSPHLKAALSLVMPAYLAGRAVSSCAAAPAALPGQADVCTPRSTAVAALQSTVGRYQVSGTVPIIASCFQRVGISTLSGSNLLTLLGKSLAPTELSALVGWRWAPTPGTGHLSVVNTTL